MTRDEAVALARKHSLTYGGDEPCQVYESIIAAILEAANGRWRGIESAPKDGTTILLADCSGGVDAGYWSSSEYFRKPGFAWSGSGNRSGDVNRPAAWQPLPPPPTA